MGWERLTASRGRRGEVVVVALRVVLAVARGDGAARWRMVASRMKRILGNCILRDDIEL